MNILSLFDGIGCAHQVLKDIGLGDKINFYFASEIDKNSILTSSSNHKNIYLGDIKNIFYKNDTLSNGEKSYKVKIDIILAGSPCQGFSFAGKQLAFDDPRSKLYFEFERLLKEIKPKYFFLENVKMRREYANVISERLDISPIILNSSLFSAQNRVRYYWTNIPQDFYVKNDVKLNSIIGEYDGIWVVPRGTNKGGLKSYNGKCPTITTSSWQHNFFYVTNRVRKTFTPEQCEQIAGLPIGYTIGSANVRIKQIGNGWSVQTVKELLKGLKKIF